MPPEMRTRATLRSAEFGFLGVVVYTRVQTPRRWGAATFFLRPLPDFKPGVASFFVFGLRPFRTSWDVVGIRRAMVAAGARARRVCGPPRTARRTGSCTRRPRSARPKRCSATAAWPRWPAPWPVRDRRRGRAAWHVQDEAGERLRH